MSNREFVDERLAQAAAGASETGAESATFTTEIGPAILPAWVPQTAGTRALWAALNANPRKSPEDLAALANISRSAATKALVALEEAGLAFRMPGGRQGIRRLPDLWQPTSGSRLLEQAKAAPADQAQVVAGGEEPETPSELGSDPGAASSSEEAAGSQPADAEPGVAPVEVATDAGSVPKPAPTANQSGNLRLRPGQLRDLVLEQLHEHPEQEFSPTTLGKTLERSSGAISNCLERLESEGVVTLTSRKPRRYRIAASS
jgi:DNA-binding MarR family transcriptional regulator